MQNREIVFLSVMITIQLPLLGVLWAMFIYLFLENFSKILKKPLDNDDNYCIMKETKTGDKTWTRTESSKF